MRIYGAIPWTLFGVSAIVSIMLWRDLRTERQIVAELRSLQNHASFVALDASHQGNKATVAAPAAASATIAPAPIDLHPAPPQKDVVAERIAEIAQRENALLERDVEYKKARLAKARITVETRFPMLARDLGLSAQDADDLFTILAESELRRDTDVVALTAKGAATDGAMEIEMARLQKEQKQRQNDAITARFGAARVTEVQEYEETQVSRQRVTTLGGVLSQAGVPLTEAQSKSLTALMISEGRRMQSEARSEPTDTLARSNARVFESNRRILVAAAGFLNPEQIAPIKARFDRAEAGSRASSVIQQRLTDSQSGATDGK